MYYNIEYDTRHPTTKNLYNQRGDIMNRLFLNNLLKKLQNVRATRGSTIVGVLAALTFITVVTSLMVKNTGAQSAASVGYGTAMTMHSTVMSGIMATEAVFAANPSTLTSALEDVHNGTPKFVPGLVSGSKNKVPLGNSTSQFFNSELKRITADVRGETQLATCNINGGTKAGGKNLKRAMAFFAVEGLKYENPGNEPPTIVIEPNCKDSTITPAMIGNTVTTVTQTTSENTTTIPNNANVAAGGNNAVYMAGNLQDGNNGMEVNGGATFEGEVRFQNKKAIFHGETFFQKDVYFLAEQSYAFEGNAYFNANITFQNINTLNIFKANVGVNGNLLADNKTLPIPGDFYINGNFSSTTTKVQGTGSAKKAYYTNTFTANQNQLDYSSKENKANNKMDIPKLMGMKSLEERRETPLISYSEILEKIKTSGADIKNVSAVTGSDGLSVTLLTNLYNTTPTAQLYQGHLVIEVNYSNKYDELKTHGLNGTYFDKKVIFLVKSGKIASNGSFYYSGPNSSTMIYIGENGQLQEFGSTGPFRGYIYIDKTNTTTENGFYWGTGSSIEGAFHNFSDKQFKWNFNGTGEPTTITYNESVLAPFFTLRQGGYTPGASGGGNIGTPTGIANQYKQEDSYTIKSSIENGTREVVTHIVTITTVGATNTTIATTTNITTTDIKTVTTVPPPYTVEICRPTQTVIPGAQISGGYSPTGGLNPRAKGYYFY